MMSDLKLKFGHVWVARCELIVHSRINISFSKLQRVDRKSLALICALVGQLNKPNDGGGFFPLDSQLCFLSDARSKILVQLDIRTVLVG